LMETPFTILRLAFKKKGLSFHIQRTSLHAYMIQMCGSIMMIWL
jgi:hypothetical protein